MRRAPMTLAATAALGLLLAACGGSTTADRAAAPEGSAAGGSPAASAAANAQQTVKVKVCVENRSSTPVALTLNGSATVDPGATQCGEASGTDSASIAGSMSVNGAEIMQLQGSYPAIGVASVTLTQPAYGECITAYLPGQGLKSKFKDDGVLQYQIVRTTKVGQQPPGVAFTVTLMDSASPSTDGQPAKCV